MCRFVNLGTEEIHSVSQFSALIRSRDDNATKNQLHRHGLNRQRKIIHSYARAQGLLSAIKIEDDQKNSILLNVFSLGMLPRLKKYEFDQNAMKAKQSETLGKCKLEVTKLLNAACNRRGAIAEYANYLKGLKSKTSRLTELVRTKSQMVADSVHEHNDIASKMAGECGKVYADIKMVSDIGIAVLGVVPGGGAAAMANRAAAAVVLPMLGETIAASEKLIRTQHVNLADALIFKGTATNYALILGQELAKSKTGKLLVSNPVGAIITALFAVHDRNEAHRSFGS